MAMNTSDKFYDRLAFLYPVVDLFLIPQKRIFFRKINEYPSGELLEIGVGNGQHLKYYRTHKITAVDTSEQMLRKARAQAGADVVLLQMNGEALSFPDQAFDYVVLSHVITVVNDPEQLLKEVHRVLKPFGKIFILNHFTPNNWLGIIDRLFLRISKWFHFKSVFQTTSLRTLEKFTLLREFGAGIFSYFKILIYEKNL
jgi:phosphatidylethanolamine/phosphatidyl-N-methylethanolamine N-methyltransferase